MIRWLGALVFALLLVACPPRANAPSAFDAERYDITLDWEPTPPVATGAPATASLTASDGSGLALAAIDVRGVLYGPLAFTEMHVWFRNDEARTREGAFAITLPDGASVSRFAMRLPTGWQEGEVAERREARVAYERTIERRVDPALLEHHAGNVFRGRVFPIGANETKEIVVAYAHPIPAGEPYRVLLRGMPEVPRLDVAVLEPSAKKAFVLHKNGWRPDRDFVHAPKAPIDVVRGGAYAIARAAPAAAERREGGTRAMGDVTVLVDSSASRAPEFVANVDALAHALAAARAGSVHVACFDQEVVPVASLAAARGRAPRGASDLASALRWARGTGASRVVVATDGIATMGARDAGAIAEAAAGIARVDAIAFGAARDTAVLDAIAGTSGAVVDGDALAPEAVGAALARSAATSRAVAPFTYTKLEAGVPLPEARMIEAPPALVERAFVQAKITALLRDHARTNDAATRERLRAEIVGLSTRHRVLTPFTAMVVLETDADYARFGIPREANANILVVGARGVELVPRGGGHVLASARPDADPMLDFGGNDARGRAGDRDRDGVPDVDDRCPDDPEDRDGYDDADGCPDPDNDSDGIPDANDKCPNEPENKNGIQDADGCPEPGRVILMSQEIRVVQYVQFENGSAVLKPASFALLDEVAKVIELHPELKRISVEGHTDNIGDPAGNKRMSEARAAAVRDALVKRGVAPARLEVHGFGETRPIAPNADAEGRAKNRRVEFRIVGREETPAPSSVRRTFEWKRPPSGAALDGPLTGGLLGALEEGRKLEAAGAFAEAARAYGSMIDLATKPEHRRAAAGFLLALSPRHPPAAALAIDALRVAAADRPDQPSGRRLLAHALARAGRLQEAFDVVADTCRDKQDLGRYPAALPLLRGDLGRYGAALVREKPSARAVVEERLRILAATMPAEAETVAVLTWETDQSDVDLATIDEQGTASRAPIDSFRGFGPEWAVATKARGLAVQLATRGPSGVVVGDVAIVRHDGHGVLSFDDRPFVVGRQDAVVSLGSPSP